MARRGFPNFLGLKDYRSVNKVLLVLMEKLCK